MSGIRLDRGTFWSRLVRGTRWVWVSDAHGPRLPADALRDVMEIQPSDRYHGKQGRSTARVRFDAPHGRLSVYLKRHERLSRRTGLGALLDPTGRHSPGAVEWENLECARALGVLVPDVVAVGEEIGPWGRLRGFLMVAEVVDGLELHEVLPALAATREPADFARIKRRLTRVVAAAVARLHGAYYFHKDLYLCHFLIDPAVADDPEARPTLIDLHRLRRHRWTAFRWRCKDLAQLLFSTWGVLGIDERDRLRFWMHYRRAVALRGERRVRALVRLKAARYRAKNGGGS
jgi:heptose I phosphotransferase